MTSNHEGHEDHESCSSIVVFVIFVSSWFIQNVARTPNCSIRGKYCTLGLNAGCP